MEEPFEGIYFNWLCAKVIDTRNTLPSMTYWRLFKQLHTTEFVWLINMDENRAAYGKELRREFLIAADAPDNPEWREVLGCSVFEMIIALSRDLDFQTDDSYQQWFWELLTNLGINEFHDASDYDPQEVDDILSTFIWRTYSYDGQGGLFPLRDPKQDQRKVEIWYQFFDYLRDQDRML
jgi:hypothetical protein